MGECAEFVRTLSIFRGTAEMRGVLLRECQEQLRDAELQRLSLLVIRGGLVLFSFLLALRSQRACPCTDVQPSTSRPRKSGRRAIFAGSFIVILSTGVQARFGMLRRRGW